MRGFLRFLGITGFVFQGLGFKVPRSSARFLGA